jgi:hypothetical protein
MRDLLVALCGLLLCSFAAAGEPIDWTFSVEERLTAVEKRLDALEKKCANCCPAPVGERWPNMKGCMPGCHCGPDCRCPHDTGENCQAPCSREAKTKPAKGGSWQCGPDGCKFVPAAEVPVGAPPKPDGEGWQYDAALKQSNPACTGWYRPVSSSAVSAPVPAMPRYSPMPSYSPAVRSSFGGGCPGGNCPTRR